MNDGAAAHRQRRAGVAFALAAYVWWGFAPFYFKELGHVPAIVILGHRIVWSVVLLAVLLQIGGQWDEVRGVLRDARLRGWLLVSTVLVAINWLIFIYSIETNRLVEASLGYFINPLISVILGMAFLREKLRPWQWVAAAIAGAGVMYLTWSHGGLPWIAVALPISFGLYGLIRKREMIGAVAGLFVETAILAPAAAAYLVWAHARHGAAINTPATLGLLSLAGVVTAMPMLWFVAAARRLPLVTIGFLQYLAPSLQLLTAVLVFGEEFGCERLTAFSIIWVALGVFVAESVARGRRGKLANGARTRDRAI